MARGNVSSGPTSASRRPAQLHGEAEEPRYLGQALAGRRGPARPAVHPHTDGLLVQFPEGRQAALVRSPQHPALRLLPTPAGPWRVLLHCCGSTSTPDEHVGRAPRKPVEAPDHHRASRSQETQRSAELLAVVLAAAAAVRETPLAAALPERAHLSRSRSGTPGSRGGPRRCRGARAARTPRSTMLPNWTVFSLFTLVPTCFSRPSRLPLAS